MKKTTTLFQGPTQDPTFPLGEKSVKHTTWRSFYRLEGTEGCFNLTEILIKKRLHVMIYKCSDETCHDIQPIFMLDIPDHDALDALMHHPPQDEEAYLAYNHAHDTTLRVYNSDHFHLADWIDTILDRKGERQHLISYREQLAVAA